MRHIQLLVMLLLFAGFCCSDEPVANKAADPDVLAFYVYPKYRMSQIVSRDEYVDLPIFISKPLPLHMRWRGDQ